MRRSVGEPSAPTTAFRSVGHRLSRASGYRSRFPLAVSLLCGLCRDHFRPSLLKRVVIARREGGRNSSRASMGSRSFGTNRLPACSERRDLCPSEGTRYACAQRPPPTYVQMTGTTRLPRICLLLVFLAETIAAMHAGSLIIDAGRADAVSCEIHETHRHPRVGQAYHARHGEGEAVQGRLQLN